VRWSALWPTYLCNDAPFLDLAQRSGLLHVNIGLESIHPDTLEAMNKRFNKTSKYGEMLANLRQRGISYSLNFIFGWDGENEGTFQSTLKFLYEHKVPAAHFNILTPVKGTPLYDRLQGEGRILNHQEIDRWPGQYCTSSRLPERQRHWSETCRGCTGISAACRPSFPACPCP
jgi:tRNA A37 methylthiotransferase MiaB